MRMFSRLVTIAGLAAMLSVTTSADQALSLRRVMRDKLAHSQQLLGAVVTSDWLTIEQHATALRALTSEPGWAVLKTPEYARQTLTFANAVDDLLEAAHDHDGEATPLAYVSVTLSCVQCHRYVARARLADQNPR